MSAAARVLMCVWAVGLAPAPAGADQADDLINTIVRDTRSRAEAAKKLLTTAESLGDAPAVQIRLCEKACEYGMSSVTGYPTALTALDMLEGLAPHKADTWRDKRLDVYRQQYYRGDKASRFANGQALIKALSVRADQCGKDDDWTSAARHLRLAYGVARTLDLPTRKEFLDSALAAEGLVRVHARLAGLEKFLEKNPADVVARRQLVMLYLVDMDRPDKAAKYVGKGLDPALARNVSLAAKDASELTDEDFVTLGKWFKMLADGATTTRAKVALLTRGRDYLRMYLEVHIRQDVKRLAAATALKGVEDALKAFGVTDAAALPEWTDMLAVADPALFTVRGTWTCVNKELTGSYARHSGIAVLLTAQGSYDLQTVFTVISGTENTTILPVGAGQVAMIFGGWYGRISGLSDVDGQNADDRTNPTKIDLGKGAKTFGLGVKQVLDVAVRVKEDMAQITAKLNGKQVLDWRGKQSLLTVLKYHRMPIKAFGLATFGSKVVWHTAKVRFLDPIDRNIEWVSKDATFTVSSTAEKYRSLKAFLTGQGELMKGCAVHTDYEAKPSVVVELAKPVNLKRILIFNRREKYSSSRQNRGLRVWTSVDGAEWAELWTAATVQSAWMIDLKAPVKARYVKFGLVTEGKSYLALAGVRIYAVPDSK